MADKIRCTLLKPLNGQAIGSEVEYSQADFDRLKKRGAVKELRAPQNKEAPAPENKAAPKAKAKK